MPKYKNYLLSLSFIFLSCLLPAQQPTERLHQIISWIDSNQSALIDIWQRALGKYIVYVNRQTREVYSTWQVDSAYVPLVTGFYKGVG
ncbi:hypothetical protein [Carboxylicivirga taeanensis]|uniref:hypothetical protein n=1 Tax=Carboxylicivirga taeanensis TaxID=1416875 RepID=UPI003F6DD76E